MNIYTSVIYSGQGNENLNANMNIFMISTVQNTVVTPNTIRLKLPKYIYWF